MTEPAAREAQPDDAWPIVGIGASAGGLEALQTLLKNLSCEHMGLVVAQHLSPTHDSLLTEILARSTSLDVVTAVDGMRVQKHRVHVLPGGADITIAGGVLHLTPSQGLGVRRPIDAFLRSLADDRGALAVGVVLSGGGSDGTLGLEAIKASGGVTFAQEPGTAAHPSMPQSAIEAGVADFTLEPTAIGDELMRIDGHVDPTRSHATKSPAAMHELFAVLRTAFGVDFSQYKPVTIHRRLERRMMLNRIDDLAAYLRFARGKPAELGALYRDLLIHVTSFFREPELFDALKTMVFPRLLAQRSPDAPIRMWIAGCSTGEEAYSAGMALLEHLDERKSRRKIQIFATDLDDDALATARLGVYPREIEKHVSQKRLDRFFTRLEQDQGYRVCAPLRDVVVFATQDLAKDPPFSRIDLISCRNVLIYMQPELQRRLLSVFHYALHPDGFLVLGSSENVAGAFDLFSPVDRRLKIFSKKSIAARAAGFAVRSAKQRVPHGPRRPKGAREPARPSDVLGRADRLVLESYGPPGLVVAEDRGVIQFRGDLAAYLAPATGLATLDARKLVRSEFLVELSAVLSHALDAGVPATSAAIAVPRDGGSCRVALDAFPLAEDESVGRCALVLFRELDSTQAPVAGSSRAPVADEVRVRELEHTLAAAREYLRATIEQADAASDDRRAESEELSAANEELQSANEELEASQEELQSTNEELTTVNEELQNRMIELGQSNDDLHNLLVAVDTPIVIVSLDLRIRRFTAAAERVFDLIPADVGRPMAHLKGFIDFSDVERVAAEVIRTETAQEHEVQDAQHRWYSMRVLPYKGSDRAVRGAVLELRPSSMPLRPQHRGDGAG